DNSTQVNVWTNRKIGYAIDHNYAVQGGYAFRATINNDQTQAISVYNAPQSFDVFTLYGNGKLSISGTSGNLLNLEPNGKFTLSNGQEKLLQLESDGLLRGRKIKLDLDSWADYVFNEDYQLMPISQLKNYIRENKHLPNIPSEK